ncbi:MAG: DDE-type integrase/transposase/recombinase [Mycoplasma sp.]|nr:DDE-type integrase/transposase/recombinase [Mycoplasma sp.]
MWKRKNVYGLIIHSDQGFQYTSSEYKVICASKGISISMSRKGTPLDDSPIESWHAILKKRLCITMISFLWNITFN